MKRVFTNRLVMFLTLALIAASWAFADDGPTVTFVNNTGKTIKTLIMKYSYSSPDGSSSSGTTWTSWNPALTTGNTAEDTLPVPLSVVNRYDVELEYTDGTTTKLGMMAVPSNLRMELGAPSTTVAAAPASAANTARSGAVALKLGEGRTVSFRGSESLWYSVDIPQNNSNFVVQTSGSMDSLLTLYNSSGEQIASDDDSGDNWNARISKTLSSGKYYIEVKNYDKNTGQCVLTASSSGGSSGTVASGSASSGSSSSGITTSPCSSCGGTGICPICKGTLSYFGMPCGCVGLGLMGRCAVCYGTGVFVYVPPTPAYTPPPVTTYTPPSSTYSSPSYSGGYSGGSSSICSLCDGKGVRRLTKTDSISLREPSTYCSICGGTYAPHTHETCPRCNGTGRI